MGSRTKINSQETSAMRSSITVVSLLLLTVSAATAHAHASLTLTSPSEGAVVTTPPHQVSLAFTDTLEAAFSKLTVTDSSGAQVSEGKVHVNDNTMRVDLKPLNAGIFKVNWRAVSSDTHKTEGSFTFRVDSK